MNMKELQDEVEKAYEYSKKPNWDEEDSKAMPREVYLAALKLIHDIPLSLPMPEVSVDCDGDISFDWYGKGTVFSLSVTVGKIVYFACVDKDDNPLSGTGQLKGSYKLPETIKERLLQVVEGGKLL